MRRTWGFQGFEEELAALPDKQGVLWFAEVDGNIVRVGALSPLEDGIGEMKRLFVRPEAETVVEGARR